jgi:hypothetical protein
VLFVYNHKKLPKLSKKFHGNKKTGILDRNSEVFVEIIPFLREEKSSILFL